MKKFSLQPPWTGMAIMESGHPSGIIDAKLAYMGQYMQNAFSQVECAMDQAADLCTQQRHGEQIRCNRHALHTVARDAIDGLGASVALEEIGCAANRASLQEQLLASQIADSGATGAQVRQLAQIAATRDAQFATAARVAERFERKLNRHGDHFRFRHSEHEEGGGACCGG